MSPFLAPGDMLIRGAFALWRGGTAPRAQGVDAVGKGSLLPSRCLYSTTRRLQNRLIFPFGKIFFAFLNTFLGFPLYFPPSFSTKGQERAQFHLAAVVPPVRGAASTPGFCRSASEPPPFQLAAEAQNCAVFNTRERPGTWPNHPRASKLFIFADGYLTIHY